MASVWIFQDPKQVAKHGKAKASWYVGYYDPAGRRRCRVACPRGGKIGERAAETVRKTYEAKLNAGTYEEKDTRTWQEFRTRYEEYIADLADKTQKEARAALDRFEKLMKPARVAYVTTEEIDLFVLRRRKQRGLRPREKVAVETINKELRHLRAAFRKAVKWKYLKIAPSFELRKGHTKEKSYVTPEHFAALYAACEEARYPKRLPYPAADWWRGLLITAYMTGWRIGALLALRREDVDLDTGMALSRAADNKGKRDIRTPLHPLVIEHLRRLPGFRRVMFPWDRAERALYVEFARLQKAAGVKPSNREGRYGFHDLRRAFATMNVDRLTAEQLRDLMQHKSATTTERYIKMARNLAPALQNLHVPDLTPKATGTEAK